MIQDSFVLSLFVAARCYKDCLCHIFEIIVEDLFPFRILDFGCYHRLHLAIYNLVAWNFCLAPT